jgi:hypothetical protein
MDHPPLQVVSPISLDSYIKMADLQPGPDGVPHQELRMIGRKEGGHCSVKLNEIGAVSMITVATTNDGGVDTEVLKRCPSAKVPLRGLT